MSFKKEVKQEEINIDEKKELNHNIIILLIVLATVSCASVSDFNPEMV